MLSALVSLSRHCDRVAPGRAAAPPRSRARCRWLALPPPAWFSGPHFHHRQ